MSPEKIFRIISVLERFRFAWKLKLNSTKKLLFQISEAVQFEDFPFQNHLELLFQCVGQKGQRCRVENDTCSFISYVFLRS